MKTFSLDGTNLPKHQVEVQNKFMTCPISKPPHWKLEDCINQNGVKAVHFQFETDLSTFFVYFSFFYFKLT